MYNNYVKLFSLSTSDFSLTNLEGNSTYYKVAQWGDTNSGWLSCRLAVMIGSQVSQYSTSIGVVWVEVGFGNTAETPNDYCMDEENYYSNKLTVTASGVASHSDREFFSIYAIFRNDGNEDVVVKEVGVEGNPTKGYNAGYHASNVLLMRKVLDTPLTIAPGESYSFNYRLRIKDT